MQAENLKNQSSQILDLKQANNDTLVDALNKAYLKILSSSEVFAKICESKSQSLSGLFLPGMRGVFDPNKNTIMVIGREPRGWGVNFEPQSCLSTYIKNQTSKASGYLNKKNKSLKNERGSSFHNFIGKFPDSLNLVWGNLYCYSWNKNSVVKSPLAEDIWVLSSILLREQIEIIRPKYIIFSHGVDIDSIALRREIFPLAMCETQALPYFDGILNKQLWAFESQWGIQKNKIQCFRIQHPSSFSKLARRARKKLIDFFVENH